MVTNNFFDEQADQSLVKTTIVEKYFAAWANVIMATQNKANPTERVGHRVGYVDLFAGPGRYRDGATSTPVRILELALQSASLRDRLVCIFNDKDEDNARSLQKAVEAIPGITALKHKPDIWNKEVGSEIATKFENLRTVPLLAFVDPWGYKGLTLKLVNAFLKDWGCDCIFFFNYSRINAGLSNSRVREHMAALFGDQRAERLAEELQPLSPGEREATIVNEIALALREHAGGSQRFVLPFCFKNATGKRTTHHLVLVSKHFKGYDVMKDIMAKESSTDHDGVPSFVYLPPTADRQLLLLGLNSPLDTPEQSLLQRFAGRTLDFEKIYEDHSVDTPFIRKNYRIVLGKLEDTGALTVIRPKGSMRTRGGVRVFGPHVTIQFPRR